MLFSYNACIGVLPLYKHFLCGEKGFALKIISILKMKV